MSVNSKTESNLTRYMDRSILRELWSWSRSLTNRSFCGNYNTDFNITKHIADTARCLIYKEDPAIQHQDNKWAYSKKKKGIMSAKHKVQDLNSLTMWDLRACRRSRPTLLSFRGYSVLGFKDSLSGRRLNNAPKLNFGEEKVAIFNIAAYWGR